MLKKFSVKNFKGFREKITLDFSDVKNYEFNSNCIKNGLLNKSIIYGRNASGKSNLGLAIFDIVGTLTDKTNGEGQYKSNYQNANTPENPVQFWYEFSFEGNSVVYSYEKSDFNTLLSEKLFINDELIIESANGRILINLPGADNLNIESDVGERISVVRYVRRNTPSINKSRNTIFQNLFDFVDGMLYFRSLRDNSYIGFTLGSAAIYEDIVKKGDLNRFKKFLAEAGILENLVVGDFGDKPTIGVKFDSGKIVPFSSLASTGTVALGLFFFWFRELSNVTFLFIDEFDAYYHHALSEFVAKQIIASKSQSVMTTHNTSLMSNKLYRPDACLLIDGKKIEPIFRRTPKELREVHNLEKIYTSGGFDEVL